MNYLKKVEDRIQENGQKAVPWTNEESQSADQTLFPLNTEARGFVWSTTKHFIFA